MLIELIRALVSDGIACTDARTKWSHLEGSVLFA